MRQKCFQVLKRFKFFCLLPRRFSDISFDTECKTISLFWAMIWILTQNDHFNIVDITMKWPAEYLIFRWINSMNSSFIWDEFFQVFKIWFMKFLFENLIPFQWHVSTSNASAIIIFCNQYIFITWFISGSISALLFENIKKNFILIGKNIPFYNLLDYRFHR